MKTARLEIQPYRKEDQQRLKALLTNEKIKETFMIPDFQKEEDLMQLVYKLQERSLSDAHYVRGIYLHDTLIGFVNDVEITENRIELGYLIDPVYHNQGYASEALIAIIQDLFTKGFEKVMAGAFESNIASRRVMEKCGMCLLDQKEEVMYHGILHPCVYYAIEKNV